jgi:uncharacterized membrane protein
MNRLNLLFFALLISFMHNYYSEFNDIFLQSFFFLFLFEFIIVKLFNRLGRNQTNQPTQTIPNDDDSSVSDTEEEKTEDKTVETKTETVETKTETVETKTETVETKTETVVNEKGSEETPEESETDTDESEESSDEPVDITEGVDVNQMEILRLLNNYESLGDSGLMDLKNKMLELDKLVEFYKNDTKKTKKE